MTVALLTVNVVLDGAAVISDLDYLDLLVRARDGAAVTFEEADAADDRQAFIGIAQGLALIAAAIPFLMWFRRAYRNLGPLGASRLRFKPGWAVGGWFVPLLNAWRPKQIANDIWRMSDPDLPPRLGAPNKDQPVARVLTLWWVFFLMSGFFYRVSFGPGGNRLEAAITATRWTLAGDLFSMIAGISAILVVRALTLRQQRRAFALRIQRDDDPAAVQGGPG
ncbi:MAG: DUF4328 domain-containing protein [Actinomycetota bacterium]|nr:DUF4328 domain-containing protein [Actinomycetota bacterium]